MAGFLLSNFVGFIAGLLTSFLSWWVLSHRMVPLIRFSPNLCKVRSEDGRGYSYGFRFQNRGKRAIIDVEIVAKLSVMGLPTGHPGRWHTVYLPLNYDGEKWRRIPRVQPVPRPGSGYTCVMYLWRASEFERTIYPEEIRRRFQEHALTLEDLLNLGTEATLQVYVLAYDEFSGARRVFLSKDYTSADIREGYFGEGLEISGDNAANPAC